MPMSHAEILVPTERASGSWNMQWRLKCPACRTDEVERADEAGDHEAVTVHPDRDDYDSPLGTRGPSSPLASSSRRASSTRSA
jgi:hypothetical protein